jgi:hypothetical protein
MLDVETLRERGIAILTPRGKLEAADFEKVGREIAHLYRIAGCAQGAHDQRRKLPWVVELRRVRFAHALRQGLSAACEEGRSRFGQRLPKSHASDREILRSPRDQALPLRGTKSRSRLARLRLSRGRRYFAAAWTHGERIMTQQEPPCERRPEISRSQPDICSSGTLVGVIG